VHSANAAEDSKAAAAGASDQGTNYACRALSRIVVRPAKPVIEAMTNIWFTARQR